MRKTCKICGNKDNNTKQYILPLSKGLKYRRNADGTTEVQGQINQAKIKICDKCMATKLFTLCKATVGYYRWYGLRKE